MERCCGEGGGRRGSHAARSPEGHQLCPQGGALKRGLGARFRAAAPPGPLCQELPAAHCSQRPPVPAACLTPQPVTPHGPSAPPPVPHAPRYSIPSRPGLGLLFPQSSLVSQGLRSLNPPALKPQATQPPGNQGTHRMRGERARVNAPGGGPRLGRLTQTHGCFSASCAVMRLAGLMVNIWLMRFLASGVTVSHSGDGNYEGKPRTREPKAPFPGRRQNSPRGGLIWKRAASPRSLPLPPPDGEGRGVPGTHVVGPGLDLLVQLVLVLVPEGWVAHQQDVQDHPCGEPQVQGLALPPSPPALSGSAPAHGAHSAATSQWGTAVWGQLRDPQRGGHMPSSAA